MLLSIIIPTYNSGRALLGCINSLRTLSTERVEVLFMDGCSKDDTVSVIENIKLSGYRLFSDSDEGVYDAMNKAVYFAKGDWLFFLGSDDRVYSGAIDEIVKGLDYLDADIVYANVEADHFDGNYISSFDFKRLLNQNICHQGIFYRKSVFEQQGLYDLRYRYWADYEFNLRCFVKSGIKWKYLPVTVAYHAAGGLSTTIARDAVFDEDLIYNVNKHIEQKFFHKCKMLVELYDYSITNRGYFNTLKKFKLVLFHHSVANVLAFLYATLIHVFNKIKN